MVTVWQYNFYLCLLLCEKKAKDFIDSYLQMCVFHLNGFWMM